MQEISRRENSVRALSRDSLSHVTVHPSREGERCSWYCDISTYSMCPLSKHCIAMRVRIACCKNMACNVLMLLHVKYLTHQQTCPHIRMPNKKLSPSWWLRCLRLPKHTANTPFRVTQGKMLQDNWARRLRRTILMQLTIDGKNIMHAHQQQPKKT